MTDHLTENNDELCRSLVQKLTANVNNLSIFFLASANEFVILGDRKRGIFDQFCLFSFIQFWLILTVFENCRKSLIQHFLRAKVHQKCQKWSTLASFLKTWSLGSNSVTRQVHFKRSKSDEKSPNWKSEMRHFRWFSNNVNDAKLHVLTYCGYYHKINW